MIQTGRHGLTCRDPITKKVGPPSSKRFLQLIKTQLALALTCFSKLALDLSPQNESSETLPRLVRFPLQYRRFPPRPRERERERCHKVRREAVTQTVLPMLFPFFSNLHVRYTCCYSSRSMTGFHLYIFRPPIHTTLCPAHTSPIH